MTETDDAWSTNANEAFVVSLVSPSPGGAPKTVASFHPSFTYPIFGEEERIFGYQSLKISLRFNASDMRPHLKIISSKTYQAIGDTEPDDVQEQLRPFLPAVAFAKKADFEAAMKQVPENWKPPGNSITTFEGEDGQYEIWQGSLADLAVKQMINRIQILVSLFIEAGTPIITEATDDAEADAVDRWTVFFLYHKQLVAGETDRFSYTFAGYSTVYRFFLFQPPTPPASPRNDAGNDFELPQGFMPFSEFPCRSRISQFIILPPYQRKGNGARMYNTIYDVLLHDKMTYEITVEDPSEAFDDLRDLADLAFLRRQQEFNDLRLNTSVSLPKTGPLPRNILPQKALEEMRLKYKIAPRQFKRLVEMHLMSKLPVEVRPSLTSEKKAAPSASATKQQEHELKLWKIIVKARLYIQHRDVLGQLEPPERIEKLEDTALNVGQEYARLLAMHDGRNKRDGQPADGNKRRLDDSGEGPANKKPRVDGS